MGSGTGRGSRESGRTRKERQGEGRAIDYGGERAGRRLQKRLETRMRRAEAERELMVGRKNGVRRVVGGDELGGRLDKVLEGADVSEDGVERSGEDGGEVSCGN